MNISQLMVYTMTLFMVAGALDKLTGGRLGLAQDFDRGLLFMGAIAIPVIGAFSIAPLVEVVLTPVITPLYQWFGADPAMFAGTLLSSDMGGYPLAMAMAGENNPAGLLSGMILGCTMGVTISYSIPVMLGIISDSNKHFLGQGILIGIGTIPVGVVVGGLVAGFPLLWMITNLIPMFILSGLIMFGQIAAPNIMGRGFLWFGKGINLILTFAFVIAVIEFQTGIVMLEGLAPISGGIEIIAAIAFAMAGALPMVRSLGWVLQKPIPFFCKKTGINEPSVMGLLASLASNVAMLALLPKMDDRGKVANIAFSVSAQSSIGGLFGFVAAMDASMLPPVLAAKLSGGVVALYLALRLSGNPKAQAHSGQPEKPLMVR